MNEVKSPATATVAGQEINAEPTGSTAINIPHPPVINNYLLSEQQGRPQVGRHPRQRIELTENNNMKTINSNDTSLPGPNMKPQAKNPVKKRLTAQELAEALGGKKSGDGYICCCPAHEDKNPSFSVSEKDGKILFNCFAGCSQESIIDALVALGLWQNKSMNPSSTKPRKKKYDQLSDKEKIGRLWKIAKASTKPAIDYFNTTRGIEIATKELGDHIRVNRYKDKLTHKYITSIVCAVTKPGEKHVEALHRTFLDGKEKSGTKMKGKCTGRGVYFDGYNHPEMIVGEGIETTLSARQATGKPAVAGLDAGKMVKVQLPNSVKDLYIIADSDSNFVGQKAAIALAEKFGLSGGAAHIIAPDDECFTINPKKMDFNDLDADQIRERFKTPVPVQDAKNGLPKNEEVHKTSSIIQQIHLIMAENGTITSSDWLPLLIKANLKKDDKSKILNLLTGIGVGTKRDLQLQLNTEEENNSVLKESKALMVEAGGRKTIENVKHRIKEMVATTERALIYIQAEWPYFSFCGEYLALIKKSQLGRSSKGVDDVPAPEIPVVTRYDTHSLELRISDSALFYKMVQSGDNEPIPKPIATPSQVVQKMLSNPMPLAPVVTGLVTHPVLDMDGRIISKEGIDEITRLMLHFGGSEFDTPDEENMADAKNGIHFLLSEVFSEFSFYQEKGLHEHLAIAFLLTGIFRKIISMAPGFLIVANVQGSGKTTLARMVHVFLTGHDLPVKSLNGNSEEANKEVLAFLSQSAAMVCFDNLLDGSELNDPTIAKVLTSTKFQGRLLGKTQEITVPTNTLFSFTGNNVTLAVDLVRRISMIKLISKEERPESKNYKHNDVVQRCLNIRRKVIHAALSITKAYFNAGCPLDNSNLSSSGFTEWDKMVRFPILWATGADILDSFTSNRNQSSEMQAMRGVIAGLSELYGEDIRFTSRELYKNISSDSGNTYNSKFGGTADNQELKNHLEECLTTLAKNAMNSQKTLTWVLKKMVGRMMDGKVLKEEKDPQRHGSKYYISKQ